MMPAIPFLVVTHEPDIAHMCKRIVHLKDGVIVEDKKITQVRALPICLVGIIGRKYLKQFKRIN